MTAEEQRELEAVLAEWDAEREASWEDLEETGEL